MHAVYYVKYFNLIEKILDIINNKHYLITCAKYHSSNMNDVHTVYPGRYCWPPSKSRMADHVLFEKENDFCTAFVLAIGWPTWESAHEVCLKYNI